MKLENKAVIDIIGTDGNKAVLTIVDSLDWKNEKEHLKFLQEKINIYLAFIESKEIYEKYPQAKDKEIVIDILGTFPLSALGKDFFDKASRVVSDAGFKLKFSQLV